MNITADSKCYNYILLVPHDYSGEVGVDEIREEFLNGLLNIDKDIYYLSQAETKVKSLNDDLGVEDTDPYILAHYKLVDTEQLCNLINDNPNLLSSTIAVPLRLA